MSQQEPEAAVEEDAEQVVDHDPLDSLSLQSVVLLRIYDVLMGLYSEVSHDKAEALMNLHDKGQIVGPLPAFDFAVPSLHAVVNEEAVQEAIKNHPNIGKL